MSKFLSGLLFGGALSVFSSPSPTAERAPLFNTAQATEIQFQPPVDTFFAAGLDGARLSGPTPMEVAFKELWARSKKPETTLDTLLGAASSLTIQQNPFAGTPLAEAYETFQSLGLDPKECTLAGSSALYVVSQALVAQGHEPIITRVPNDLDILVVGKSAEKIAEMGVVKHSSIGGFQAKLELEGGKGDDLDFTSHWPTSKFVTDAQGLSEMTREVGGVRVMEPEHVLNYKSTFFREKDVPDLVQATKVLQPEAEVPKGTLNIGPMLEASSKRVTKPAALKT